MLILSRKKGQKLIINDNIEIVIIESEGGIVKLGINAPRNISIYREEIYRELKKSNIVSTETQVNALSQLNQEISNISIDKKMKSLSVKIAKDEEK